MNNKPTTQRMPYEPPLLDLYEYVVEHGFATSPEATAKHETFSEITTQSTSTEAGENYHGEWY